MKHDPHKPDGPSNVTDRHVHEHMKKQSRSNEIFLRWWFAVFAVLLVIHLTGIFN